MECVICFEEINSDSRQLECGHTFHNKCINEWIYYNLPQYTCPCCNAVYIIRIPNYNTISTAPESMSTPRNFSRDLWLTRIINIQKILWYTILFTMLVTIISIGIFNLTRQH